MKKNFTWLYLLTLGTGCLNAKDDLEAVDLLRDIMLKRKQEMIDRKKQGNTYLECLNQDGSMRCRLGYVSQQCVAPDQGNCSVVLSALGKTATCDAANGATCTASVRLVIENKGKLEKELKETGIIKK